MWVDLEITKLRQKDNIIWYCLYAESVKKNDTNEPIYKAETDSET